MFNRMHLKITIIIGALLASSVCGAAVRLTSGGVSGQWYDPARNGEGISVEIVDGAEGQQIAVTWYTYDHVGFQMWLVGNVPLEGNPLTVDIPVFATGGPSFGPAYDPNDLVIEPWGTLTLTFPDCDSAVMIYDSEVGFGSGIREMIRLTQLTQVQCPPPPYLGELTPGTWTGDGICFNVSEDGSTLTPDGSQCPGSLALDAAVPGKDNRGDDCTARQQCGGEISITAGIFSCPTVSQGASGTFTSMTTADGIVRVSEGLLQSCTGTWDAAPAEP